LTGADHNETRRPAHRRREAVLPARRASYTDDSTWGSRKTMTTRSLLGRASRIRFAGLGLVLAAAGAAPSAFAQRTVPFQNGIPVAPQGLANKPLGAGPFTYATGEGQDIRVAVVTKELSFPFSIAFLPDGTMLVTERKGDIRVIKNGKL